MKNEDYQNLDNNKSAFEEIISNDESVTDEYHNFLNIEEDK